MANNFYIAPFEGGNPSIVKTFFIVPVNKLCISMIDESCNEETTMRYSLDESEVILKFDTRYPDSMIGYVKYTYEEIIEILKTKEWYVKPQL